MKNKELTTHMVKLAKMLDLTKVEVAEKQYRFNKHPLEHIWVAPYGMEFVMTRWG